MSYLHIYDQKIDQSEADYLIDLFKSSNDYTIDQGREILCNPISDEISDFIRKYGKIALQHHLESGDINEIPYVADFLIIKNGVGSFCAPHRDEVSMRGKYSFTMMLYLNDDFNGGILEFPEINKAYKPKALTFLSFDSMLLHQVTMITSGSRYAVSIGFIYDKDVNRYPIERIEV